MNVIDALEAKQKRDDRGGFARADDRPARSYFAVNAERQHRNRQFNRIDVAFGLRGGGDRCRSGCLGSESPVVSSFSATGEAAAGRRERANGLQARGFNRY